MRSDAFKKLQALVTTLRHGSKSTLVELYGRRPSKVEEILQTRQSREKEGGFLLMKDVLNIVKRNKKLFNIDDPGVTELAKFALFYEEKFATGKQVLFPRRVVSVDLGPVNSAFCLLEQGYRVREWRRLDMRLPSPYSPGQCYRNISSALEGVPSADLYILEEQSQRLHGKGFLGISVQLRALEATVYALLSQRNDGRVQSLLPTRVASYFEIAARGSAKKTAAVGVVKELIGRKSVTPLGEQVNFPEEVVKYFKNSKKKDDLSDCLLQGLCVLDWSTMCHLML